MTTFRAESPCHVSAPPRVGTALGSSASDIRRRHRAIVMLALFSFVLLRTLTVCHEPNGVTSRLGVQSGIDVLIASAFCGTLDTPIGSPSGGTTSHTPSAMCLHCASGCHGASSLQTFWMLWAFGLAMPLVMRINRDSEHTNPSRRDNLVRGPPAG
jgi:hypothetical protein